MTESNPQRLSGKERVETHNSLRILFVDDERSLQEFMRSELPRLGHEVTVCVDGKAALKVLEKGKFDIAILDLRMPGMTGIEVLGHLKQVSPDTEAIVMTGHASQETAIEALRLGAFDYITKPCKLAEIQAILARIGERRTLQHKNLALQSRVQAAEGPTILVGDSPAMMPIQRLIATVAPTDSTVLILGETGTGKELVARALWQQSKRGDMPFVPVNCGALAENLVESELFGHRKGAFTGADRDHKGLFEVANGGTLFLDEVGELNKNIQVKLLRFLESGEIRRLGETEPFKTDVRVLCATNREVRDMIHEDLFREDLYFRINTFEIKLPPLRERRPDIPDPAPAGARDAPADGTGRGAADAGSDRRAAGVRLERQRARDEERDGVRAYHLGRPADPGRTLAASYSAAQQRAGDDQPGERQGRWGGADADAHVAGRAAHAARDRDGARPESAEQAQRPQADRRRRIGD